MMSYTLHKVFRNRLFCETIKSFVFRFFVFVFRFSLSSPTSADVIKKEENWNYIYQEQSELGFNCLENKTISTISCNTVHNELVHQLSNCIKRLDLKILVVSFIYKDMHIHIEMGNEKIIDLVFDKLKNSC